MAIKIFGLSSINANPLIFYRDKICVYNEHPIAGRDIQCRAPYSQSRYTTPFDENNLFLTVLNATTLSDSPHFPLQSKFHYESILTHLQYLYCQINVSQ